MSSANTSGLQVLIFSARIDLPRPIWELSNGRVRCWKILRMADAGRLDRGQLTVREFLAGRRFVNGSRCPRDGHAESERSEHTPGQIDADQGSGAQTTSLFPTAVRAD